MDFEKIKKYFESEEGEKHLNDYAEQFVKSENIKKQQCDRLYKSGKFVDFIEKVICKYESDEYRDKWYNRGFEPPEDLYWFLYYYSQQYGRQCDDVEWKQYSNMFTSNLYFCDGYYFNRMDGQGSFIKIIKK